MKKIEFTESEIQNIVKLYQAGMAITPLAEKLNLDKGVLERLLKKHTVMRTKGEAQRLCMGIKFVKSDAFDILSPEALYWIGFIYADGFIEGKYPVLGISISEKDKEHVEKFNQFLGGGLVVATIKANGNSRLRGHINQCTVLSRIKVADRRLYDRLRFLGITNNKSSDAKPHELLKCSRDFWRGVVDGDGWLCRSKKKDCNKLIETVGLSGTEDTLNGFMDFVRLSGINANSKPGKDKRGNVWGIDLHSTIAKNVSKLLYQNATVYLERKYKTYKEFFNQ